MSYPFHSWHIKHIKCKYLPKGHIKKLPLLRKHFELHFLERKYMDFLKIPLKYTPRGPINNFPALVQIMARCPLGEKPLFWPMVSSLLTHISVTRPQRVICYTTPLLVTAGKYVHCDAAEDDTMLEHGICFQFCFLCKILSDNCFCLACRLLWPWTSDIDNVAARSQSYGEQQDNQPTLFSPISAYSRDMFVFCFFFVFIL